MHDAADEALNAFDALLANIPSATATVLISIFFL
jgi:hypothetical protein